VTRAEVQVANAKLAVVRAENLVRISGGELNTSMGLPVEMSLEVEADLAEMTSPDAIDITASFDQAVHHRPELKASFSAWPRPAVALTVQKRIWAEGKSGGGIWVAGFTIPSP